MDPTNNDQLAVDGNAILHAENRSTRLKFPPSYVVVGIYRLLHDESLYIPIWDKCRHGVRRGGILALVWASLTYKVQKTFVEFFLVNSPRITGLSCESLFGYKLPVTVATYATLLFLSSQMEWIIVFFLSKNIRISRERAWNQTMKSRGKGPDFWQPYYEEYQRPPIMLKKGWNWKGYASNHIMSFFIRVILFPLNFYPLVGIIIKAGLKGIQTSSQLHRPYFAAKRMTQHEVALFIEERKWDYRIFGFTAALVEAIPFAGLLFTVSNRIGAAMWAHDLEKRQHMFRSGEMQRINPIGSPYRQDN